MKLSVSNQEFEHIKQLSLHGFILANIFLSCLVMEAELSPSSSLVVYMIKSETDFFSDVHVSAFSFHSKYHRYHEHKKGNLKRGLTIYYFQCCHRKTNKTKQTNRFL